MRSNLLMNIIYGIIVFILVMFQSSGVLAIGGVNPDIILILVVLHSIYFGEYTGVIFGFAMGLTEDLLGGTLFGINSFILSLVAWLISIYRKYVFVTEITAFIIYVLIVTILKYILYLLLNLIFTGSNFLGWAYLLRMLGELLYNSALGALFFLASPFLYRREENPF